MKKYQQAALSIAFLTLIFTGSHGVGYSISMPDNHEQKKAILTTFETKDYQAWKQRIGKNSKIGRLISEQDFNRFVEARFAVRRGEYQKGISISKQLENDLKNKIGLIRLS